MSKDDTFFVVIVNVDEESVEAGAEAAVGEEIVDSGAAEGCSRLPPSYRFGRSRVTEEVLDQFVVEGLFSSGVRQGCRAPGREEVPNPEPYEAVVFRDFCTTGLAFPCEAFFYEVLDRFNLQIHQLTPKLSLG